ncbi:RodZ domain-containing protein [Ostreibacterium oceani]|uniref:DUF4115 domain-containing protein n=1 Tax=Ostreibacterium oceani TaxID=2654998 RepID=A0A6N7EXJ6_9GAMM|nr:RodZ domain-containing protein [Ostreibacterium oceani]MPV85857.1 DUF4115 domain-containing protein [Ostreibacterium oceani]
MTENSAQGDAVNKKAHETAEQPSADLMAAPIDIGADFRQSREALQISIDEAAKTTKLTVSVIESIEDNEFTAIGTAVYVRGYLGIYAKYLGLNASEYIAAYDAQYPQENIALRPSVAHNLNGGRQKTKRHSKTLSFAVALVSFVGLIYAYLSLVEPRLFRQSVGNDTALTARQSGAASNADNSGNADNAQTLDGIALTSTAIDATTGAENDTTDATVARLIDEANQANTLASDVLGGANNNAANGSDVAGTALTDGESPAVVLESPENETNNETGDEAATDEAATDETPVTATLKIRFNQDAWIQIKDATGENLAINTYGRNKSIDISGELPFVVNLARPEAIDSILFNDAPINIADYKVGNIQYEITTK